VKKKRRRKKKKKKKRKRKTRVIQTLCAKSFNARKSL